MNEWIEWIERGECLKQVHNEINFEIGDWLLEQEGNDEAYQYIDWLDYSLMSKLKRMAVMFAPAVRGLSWTSYIYLARLEDPQRTEILTEALKYGLRSKEVLHLVKRAKIKLLT